MDNFNSNWSKVTTDVNTAMVALLECIQAGYNGWIELKENVECEYPIMVANPLLDDPFNWTSMFGVPRTKQNVAQAIAGALNSTEVMLIKEYINCFGSEKAVRIYQETGEITKDLINTMGIPHPVKIVDANKYRELFVGDNYKYDNWMNTWRPKNDIVRKIADPSIGKVFVVRFDKGKPAEKKEKIRKAILVLQDYLEDLEKKDN